MMKSSDKLRNKTIVITGASSGVGRAIAVEFAPYQTKLVLTARNKAALQEVANECTQLGAQILVMESDVSNPGDLIRLADEACQFGSRIDIWINNAGVLALGPFENMPLEVHRQVVETNLMGYINGAHAILPYFKRQGHGILINNISIGGYLPIPFGTSYAASKFGVRGFCEALRAELGKWKNIHICEVFPAFLDTPGMQHAANYTNKYIQPMPPVYDPVQVAKKIIRLAARPKASSAIHFLSKGLQISYLLAPNLTLWAARYMINSYLKQAEDAAKTDGNLFYPLPFGTGISGGWKQLQVPKLKRSVIAVSFMLGLALLAGINWKKN